MPLWKIRLIISAVLSVVLIVGALVFGLVSGQYPPGVSIVEFVFSMALALPFVLISATATLFVLLSAFQFIFPLVAVGLWGRLFNTRRTGGRQPWDLQPGQTPRQQQAPRPPWLR